MFGSIDFQIRGMGLCKFGLLGTRSDPENAVMELPIRDVLYCVEDLERSKAERL